MTRDESLTTLAVSVITIVTGSGPQSNTITPPAATASTTARDVQLAGVPLPITRSGSDVSTGTASGGSGTPPGLPGGGGVSRTATARERAGPSMRVIAAWATAVPRPTATTIITTP